MIADEVIRARVLGITLAVNEAEDREAVDCDRWDGCEKGAGHLGACRRRVTSTLHPNACPTCDEGMLTITHPSRCRECIAAGL